MGNDKVDTFYRKTILGIMEYLRDKFNLIHRDQKSVNDAEQLGVKIKGLYTLLPYKNAPKLITIRLRVSPVFRKDIQNNEKDLTQAAGLPEHKIVNIKLGSDRVILIEVPKPKELHYIVRSTELPNLYNNTEVVLGPTTDLQKYITLDLAGNNTSHLMVTGMTGSGKTQAVNHILGKLIKQCKPEYVRIALIDVEKGGLHFDKLEGANHLLYPVIKELDTARGMFQYFEKELNDRKRKGLSGIVDSPHLFLVVDEIQGIFKYDDLVDIASQITAKGREYRVHLIAATQYTNSSYLGDSDVIKNMARLVGLIPDARLASHVSGIAKSGVEKSLGNGDFVLISSGAHRVQMGLPTESFYRSLPKGKTDYIDLNIESEVESEFTPKELIEAMIDPRYENLREVLGIGTKRAGRLREEAALLLSKNSLLNEAIHRYKRDLESD